MIRYMFMYKDMYKVLYNIPKPMLRCFKTREHRSPERLPRLPAEECEPCGAMDGETMVSIWHLVHWQVSIKHVISMIKNC